MVVAGISEEELAVSLAPPVGLRTIRTHQYLTVDQSVVVRAVPLARDRFRRYLAAFAVR